MMRLLGEAVRRVESIAGCFLAMTELLWWFS